MAAAVKSYQLCINRDDDSHKSVVQAISGSAVGWLISAATADDVEGCAVTYPRSHHAAACVSSVTQQTVTGGALCALPVFFPRGVTGDSQHH
jgi:hypothetical protein